MSGIIGGIAAGAILLMLRSAARNAKSSTGAKSTVRVARYPVAARVLIWLLALVAIGFWAILLQAPRDQLRTGIIVCSSITVGVIVLFLEFTYARASWSESRLMYYSPWGRTRTINWEEIADVRFSARLSWIAIQARSGTVIRLPTLMGGLTELLETLKQKADRALQPSIAETMVFLRIQ